MRSCTHAFFQKEPLVDEALKAVRQLHIAFVTTWFLFLLLFKFLPPPTGSPPAFLPTAMGMVCVSDVTLAFFWRSRYVSASIEILRAQPENASALARWRTGNILSFAMAETVTLFGFALRYLGAPWNVAGIFFAVGLALLLLWTPRAISSRS